MGKERLNIWEDNIAQGIIKLCEGNPGAAMALAHLYEKGPKIDPQNALGGIGPIMKLDEYGIYGTDIYVLWSDLCEKNTARMIAVLRAIQLGFVAGETVADAAHRQDYSGREVIDVRDLYEKVTKHLNQFDEKGEGKYE